MVTLRMQVLHVTYEGTSQSHFELNTKYIRYKFLKVVATAKILYTSSLLWGTRLHDAHTHTLVVLYATPCGCPSSLPTTLGDCMGLVVPSSENSVTSIWLVSSGMSAAPHSSKQVQHTQEKMWPLSPLSGMSTPCALLVCLPTPALEPFLLDGSGFNCFHLQVQQ